MPDWQFAVGQREPEVSLPTARGRQVSLRLKTPSTASFTLDARRPEASSILELASDLHCYRDGEYLFRGVVGTTTDEIGEDAHEMTVDATDYRGRLQRLFAPYNNTYSSKTFSFIAWDQIDEAQGASAGADLGITQGDTSTSAVFSDTVYAGMPVFEVIERFADGNPGYDWTITPELVLECWDQRGRDSDVVLFLGGSVRSVSRTFDPTLYANVIRATGYASGVSYIGGDPGVVGRWESARAFNDVVSAGQLAKMAGRALSLAATASEQYTVVMQANWWQGPDHLDVGDRCQLVLKSGRLNLDRQIRVQDITINIGESGDEVATLTLSDVSVPYWLRLQEFERRLRSIEFI